MGKNQLSEGGMEIGSWIVLGVTLFTLLFHKLFYISVLSIKGLITISIPL